MVYEEKRVTTIRQLKSLAEKTKKKHDELELAQGVIAARMDAQVIASTESNADYAAEMVDARVDIWANVNTSVGSGIRSGQQRMSEAIEEVQASHQAQIDEVAEARMENAVEIAESNASRREEITSETNYRVSSDEVLQRQIDTLSNAIIEIVTQLSEIRERIR